MFNTMLVGLLFAFMTDVTGSLWLAAGAHSIWNFLFGPFLGLNLSGIPIEKSVLRFQMNSDSTSLHGGLYGPEASLLVTAIVLIFIISFAVAYFKKGHTVSKIEHCDS